MEGFPFLPIGGGVVGLAGQGLGEFGKCVGGLNEFDSGGGVYALPKSGLCIIRVL